MSRSGRICTTSFGWCGGGTVELTTNGKARRMEAGDVGICVAGDRHFIQNVGATQATYFVVTVGPPE
jgi:quercetin dioxygenase-like cupin family protein